MTQIAEALAKAERVAFLEMIADPKWAASKIYVALRDEGCAHLPETDQFIGEHRRRKCGCP